MTGRQYKIHTRTKVCKHFEDTKRKQWVFLDMYYLYTNGATMA